MGEDFYENFETWKKITEEQSRNKNGTSIEQRVIIEGDEEPEDTAIIAKTEPPEPGEADEADLPGENTRSVEKGAMKETDGMAESEPEGEPEELEELAGAEEPEGFSDPAGTVSEKKFFTDLASETPEAGVKPDRDDDTAVEFTERGKDGDTPAPGIAKQADDAAAVTAGSEDRGGAAEDTDGLTVDRKKEIEDENEVMRRAAMQVMTGDSGLKPEAEKNVPEEGEKETPSFEEQIAEPEPDTSEKGFSFEPDAAAGDESINQAALQFLSLSEETGTHGMEKEELGAEPPPEVLPDLFFNGDAEGMEGDIHDEVREANGLDEGELKFEQVESSLFGESADEYGEEEGEEELDNGITGDRRKGEKDKIDFTALRTKQRVPRLKKTLVLSLTIGFVGIFLILVNILIGNSRRKQEEAERNRQTYLDQGEGFTLGDYKNRGGNTGDDFEELPEDKFVPIAPPAYEPITKAPPAAPPSGVVRAAPVSSSRYSESDLEAIRAKIRKEAGYGGDGAGTVASGQMEQIGNMALNPAMMGTAGMGTIPSKDEYMSDRINDIASLVNATSGGGKAAAQEENRNNGRYTEAGRYNAENSGAGDFSYLGENVLFPGTIITAVLQSRIDTDYPGPIFARVSENVYDSKTGKNLLIPQGTILMGDYSSSSIGVAKVQIAWKQMIVNYDDVSYQMSLGGMAGVDRSGRAGIGGTLDDHYFEWLKAAGIVSLFTMLNSEVSYQMGSQKSPQVRELMETNQAIVNELGTRIMERALDIQPTVRVANGKSVSVAVNTALTLRPFAAIKAEGRYIRR
jgi:type IV secretion system protein VirB10